MRWSHRFRQFLMRTRVSDAAVARRTAKEVLPKAAYRLFEKMSPGDQTHGLCVLRALGGEETASPDVAQAALLHDVGKVAGRLSLPFRVLVVFLEWVGRGLLERLASAEPTSWRYPFYVHVHHAELGASRCREAGCSPLTVDLVRHHERPVDEVGDDSRLKEALIALKKADESC